MALSNRITFAVIIGVDGANPNGNPMDDNRPRVGFDGLGEITAVCIKRKIRDRWQEKGGSIFVQSDRNNADGCKSLKDRATKNILRKGMTPKEIADAACAKYDDVRAFGAVMPYKGDDNKKEDSISVGIVGPVSIRLAKSVTPVNVITTQITKSVNGVDTSDGKKSSDTIGSQHRVDNTTYVFWGEMNPQYAEKTGFSEDDMTVIKEILPKLFINDASEARPAGTMWVKNILWWDHGCKEGKCSTRKIIDSLTVNGDGSFEIADITGLEPEIIEGF